MLELSKETFEFYAAFITGITLIFTAWLFSVQTTDSYILIKSVIAQFGVICLLSIYLLYIIYRRMIRFAFYPVYWPLVIYTAAVLFSLVSAVNRPIALQKTVELILLLLFFVLISQRKLSVPKLIYVSTGLIMGGGLIGAYGILTNFGYHLFGEKAVSAISTMGNPDFTAEWLAPLIPLSILLAVENGKTWLSGLMLFSSLIMLVCVGFTLSIGSIVSLLVGCAIVYRLSIKSPHTIGHKQAGLIGIILMLFIVATLGLTYYYYKDKPTFKARLSVWQTTSTLIKDHTLGVGRGSFFYVYPLYIPAERWLADQDSVVVHHVSNEYVEAFVESGVIGGAAFIIFFLMVYNQLARSLRKTRAYYRLAAGFGAGWLVMALNGIVSFNLHNPATGLLFWFITGGLVSLIEPTQQKKHEFDYIKDMRWGIYAVGCLIPLALLFYTYYPLASNTYLKKAYNLYTDGEENKAAVELRSSIKFFKYNYQSHLLLGNILLEQGDIKKAIGEFELASKLNPNYPDIYTRLGQLYQDDKQYNAAIQAYLKALKINPNSLGALNNLGSLYAVSNETEAAEKVFHKALEISPEQGEVYYNLGNLMLSQEKDDMAVLYYVKAIQADPKQPQFHNNLGVLHKKNGRYEQAVKEFLKVISLDPNYISAFNNLGNTFLAMKRYQQAIKHYRKAIALNPEYRRARFNLAYAYEQMGDMERAVLEWRKISQQYPNSPEGKEAIGNLIRLGRLKRIPVQIKQIKDNQ